jgi:hypothetical protein
MTTKAAPVPTQQDEFAGMTLGGCCSGCTVNHCVISGAAYCGHPGKGALHPQTMHDPAALERHARAKLVVEHMRLDWMKAANKG